MRLILVFTIAALTACGFQLRGSGQVETFAAPVYLSGESQGLLAQALRRSLQEHEVLASSLTGAALEVLIDQEETSRQTASVGSDTRVRDVELRYAARLNWRRAAQDEFESQVLQLRREYTYNVAGVLGSANEEELLYEEMRRELVRRLRQRIAALTRETSL